MTDNDIIKALECCVIDNSCSKCPHYNNGKQTRECLEMSIKFAIDLINRQKAEIRKYKNCYEQVKWERDLFEEQCKAAKAEAIKEFAEQVKMAFYYEFDELIPSIMADKIDKLVKEMTGDNDAEE